MPLISHVSFACIKKKSGGSLHKILFLILILSVSSYNISAQCPATCPSGSLDLNPTHSSEFSTGMGVSLSGDGYLSMLAGANGTVGTISNGDTFPTNNTGQLCLSADFNLTTSLDLTAFPLTVEFRVENICGTAPCPAIEFSQTLNSTDPFSLGGLLSSGLNTSFDPNQSYQIIVTVDLGGMTIPESFNLSYSDLQLTACVPPTPGVDQSITVCVPFESLIPGTDRNNFSSELSDGYLNNYQVPNLPSCTCGTATLEGLEINIDINSITFPTPTPADCAFFSVFGNVYVSPNPIPLGASGSYVVQNEVLQGVCANSGEGSMTTGNYSLDILGCGTTVNPGDYLSIDIIPAINYGGSAACASVNGNGVNGNYVDVDYDICIDFNFECPDLAPAFIKN